MINLSKYSILLLAAGTGKRFGKKGKKHPKSLIKIKKKYLIEIIIDILKKRKAKQISIVLGYKSHMILKVLKKIKGIRFNIIKIENFRKNNHGCSWHSFKKSWFKKKMPILLLHTDIFFNPLFLDNIIRNKNKNIIGIHSNSKIFKKNSLVVEVDKKQRIKKINYIPKIKNFLGEVIGINKISKLSSEKIFNFMDKFLVGRNKKLPWEIVINNYIKFTRDSLYAIKKQNYYWVNINSNKDYVKLRKFCK